MTDTDLCYLPGFRALEWFKAGKISPVEVLEAQIRRAEVVNPTINAYTDTYYDEAMTQARRAESAFARKNRKGSAPRPLEGLTVAVKDSQGLAGKRTTHGSIPYRDEIAAENSPANQRLLDAGAIVVGKTTTPEFSCLGVTHSKLFGVTGTPWNPAYTSGGSSGGSAASLAAGMVTLATGSDIAGSIRVPAACCGVAGYKPPYGRIPGDTPFNLDFYCQTGPLARTIGDCALMTNVMAGAHPADIATLRETLNLPLDYPGVRGWRIACSADLGIFTIAPEVRENLLKTVALLRELGAEVEQVEVGWDERVTAAAVTYLERIFGQNLVRNYQQYGDALCDYTIFYAKRAAAAASDSGSGDLLATFEVVNQMYRRMGAILEEYDAFICPVLATHEVAAAAKPWDSICVNGKPMTADFDWVMTHPFNMLSRLPVLAVPNGMAENGLPTGIQIVSRSYDDRRVFQLARALETASPWLDCAGRRPAIAV